MVMAEAKKRRKVFSQIYQLLRDEFFFRERAKLLYILIVVIARYKAPTNFKEIIETEKSVIVGVRVSSQYA